MKKRWSLILVILILSLYSLPVHALSWPPPSYDMPRTVLNSESLDYLSGSVRMSYASVTNIGIKILGIVLSVGLISKMFIHKE